MHLKYEPIRSSHAGVYRSRMSCKGFEEDGRSLETAAFSTTSKSIIMGLWSNIQKGDKAMVTTKHVALYARVSTTTQQNGLNAQLLALETYCKTHGIENYSTYQDFGISGSKVSRPQLNRLMDDCRSGAISSIICYSFSRFARSTKHLLSALEEFRELGIRFISITEQIDTNSAIGTAFFTIVAAMAQLERELVSERVKCGLSNARSKGKALGRPIIHDNTKVILELRGNGYSYSEISRLVSCSPSTVSRKLKAA